jgi:hypothetical protein
MFFAKDKVSSAAEKTLNAIWDKREKAVAEYNAKSWLGRVWVEYGMGEQDTLFRRENYEKRTEETAMRILFKAKESHDIHIVDSVDIMPLEDFEIDAIRQYWEHTL